MPKISGRVFKFCGLFTIYELWKKVSSFYRYGRALEIIQDEEYLEASDFDEIRRHKRSAEKLKNMNFKLNGRRRIKRQTINGKISNKYVDSGCFSSQNFARILFRISLTFWSTKFKSWECLSHFYFTILNHRKKGSF